VSGASGWGRLAARLARSVERRTESARTRVFGARIARQVVPYIGFGTPAEVFISGRVLSDRPVRTANATDRWWQNLAVTLQHLDSAEVPGARVRVSALGATAEVLADDEGFFRAWLAPGDAPPPLQWHEVRLQAVAPLDPAFDDVSATGLILIPPRTAAFGIISDLDDTVIRTDATRMLRMLQRTLLQNARTRLPFPGVAAFYDALRAGSTGDDANPVFYVSSSPWNLYPLLSEFLEHQQIPAGPLVLRDWGISDEGLLPLGHASHKRGAIAHILHTYPDLPFILIGDSGQEDPEIYRDVVHDHGDRILAVYIRDVTPNPGRRHDIAALADEVRLKGSSLLLSEETAAAARHAAGHGWIRADAVGRVEREVSSSEERPG
jgi:phosphatidate phosphatase APP1